MLRRALHDIPGMRIHVTDGELAAVARPPAESILYLCALIADRPRAIDRYIDYFGGT
jgi:hypothetical protein